MAITIPLKLKYRVPKAGSGGQTGSRTGSAKKKKPKMKQGWGNRRRAYGPF